MVLAFQTNIPEFQEYSPLSTYFCAVCRSGFSLKASTEYTTFLHFGHARGPAHLMYPNCVLGNVGLMPNVIRASGSRDRNSNASIRACCRTSGGSSNWSAVTTAMDASGSYLARMVAARPMAPAVSRTVGSAMTLFSRKARQVLPNDVHILDVRQDKDVAGIENGKEPLHTSIQERLPVQQLEHLLGALLPAERP